MRKSKPNIYEAQYYLEHNRTVIQKERFWEPLCSNISKIKWIFATKNKKIHKIFHNFAIILMFVWQQFQWRKLYRLEYFNATAQSLDWLLFERKL